MSYQYGQQIYHLLLADIQNHYGVSALMGNLVAESNLNPKNLQNTYESSLGYTDDSYTQAVDNGTYTKNQFVNDEAGYGLAQWTYSSRKQGLYEMKQSMGVSIGSVELACTYLLYELKNTYTSVYNSLKNATNIRIPSDVVLHDFENPADQSESVEIYRASLGTEIYRLYSGLVNVFEPRLTEPISDNKYYIHTSAGGFNECIEIANGSVLPNCVGYAWGRAYEIMKERHNLSKNDAEVWYGNTPDGYSRGQVAKLGAIICWAKGTVGDDSDGSGHVAVVEGIESDGTIITSNSAYGGTRFYTQTITPVNNKYELSGYTFQGFIYLPISFTPDIPDVPSVRRKRKKFNFLLFNRKRFNYYG